MISRAMTEIRWIAERSDRHHLVRWAIAIFFSSMMFFPDWVPAYLFYAAVIPLTLLAILNGRAGRILRSSILLFCIIYIVTLIIAGVGVSDAADKLLWRSIRHGLAIALVLYALAKMVLDDTNGPRVVVIVVGLSVAVSALLNMVLFFNSAGFSLSLEYLRLVATVGLTGYENSTNISATYAVYAAGLLALIVSEKLGARTTILLSAAAAILLVAVTLTQSRNALLAVGVSMVALIVVSGRYRPQLDILAGLAVVVGLLVFLTPGLSEGLLNRGLSYRLEIWSQYFDLFLERPFFGHGMYASLPVSLSSGSSIDQAHNLVLNAAVRGGVLSALALVAILVLAIWLPARARRLAGSRACFSMMVAIAVLGVFDYALLMTIPAWEWITFWLPIGMAIGMEAARRQRGTEVESR